ncbi:MAG: TolC family outer membrane protein, partial [Pseudomonadota bacterium]
ELDASAQINANLLLFDNGDSRLAIDAQKETVLATREALVALEQDVLLNAVDAYLDVISAIEFVSLGDNNVRVLTQELRAAEDRFEVGEVTRTDVALAESRLAAARSSRAAAQGQLSVARESYRVAVGRYPGTLSPVPRAPKVPGSQKEAEAIAVKMHPSIRQAQRQVTVAELNIARAEAAMKFTVTAGAFVRTTRDDDPDAQISLNFNQPIYSGGALRSALRESKANRDAQRAALLSTTHNIRQAVGNAWSNLAVAVAQIDATERQVEAAEIAFRGFQEEAKLGSRTTLDVLDAEQDLLDARANRIDAQTQQYLAIYQLLSSMGLLTVEHLGLGIQTYDPSAYYNAVKSAPIKRSRQGRQLDRVLERLGKN